MRCIDQAPLFDDFLGKLVDQRDELQQHAQIEARHRDLAIVFDGRRTPIGPFAGNAEASAFYMTQQQCVDARHPARLQDREALSSEGMKRMADLSPTQMLVERLCSSR